MNEHPTRSVRVLCLLCLLLAAPGAAAPGPDNPFIIDAVPGGLMQIPLAERDQPQPQAWFGQERALVMTFGRRWAALIGLPMSLVPGSYVLRVKSADTETDEPDARKFTVYPRRREGQSLVTLPGPPPDARGLDLAWRDALDAALPLGPPVALPARAAFGGYRPSGRDGPAHADFVVFTIRRDLSVRAPAAGRVAAVVAAEAGAWLWIDHGMSLYSRIGPVSTTGLDPEAAVSAGQVIGRVRLDEDETPHSLYLSVFMNGAAINPFLIADIDEAPSR